MADNVTIPTTGAGTATPVIATDDVASVHYQKIKIALGADGAIDTLLDSGQQLSANSAPVVLASDHGDIKITLDGEGVTISGTVQVQSNSANLATETTAAAIQAAVELLDTSLAIMDDWDESDRAKVNLIQNEAGITGGQGPVESNTPRVTLASNDEHLTTVNESLSDISTNTYNTATSVGVMDDWDESDRAKVNIIAGQAGVSAGAGAVAVNTPRVTLASDDPAVAELQVVNAYLDSLAGGQMPAYIEDAPAVANPNGGAIALVRDDSRGGGLTTANGDIVMARGNNKGEQYVKDTDAAALLTTIDTDTGAISSTMVALAGALASVATDALTANIIAGETGVAGGTGNAGANTIRVVSAADDLAVAALDNIYLSLGAGAGADLASIEASAGSQVASLGVMDDWDESDRAKVNIIAGQAGVSAGAGAVAANTPRVTLASDDPGVGHLSDISNAAQDTLTEMQTLSAATKREDDPHNNNDRGIPALAVRRDAATSGTSADGDYATLNVDASGRLYVAEATLQGQIAELLNALSSYANDALLVGGDIAHDSGDGNNPVKIGHRAKAFDGTAPGIPVDEDDRVDSIADVYGRQFVETTHPAHWTVSADYASAQTNTSLKSAPGVGLKLYITDVIVSNGATAGNITLLDGSGGTVKLELYPGVNGGLAHPFRTPIALTANTALCITSTTVTTHSVTICGYTAP
ncbi:MAG: hypothetical protein KA314_04460 [Chloroflexi bacterium]|nr:hypothetical protein [Chloroflexota bacterium]